ncbi:unnamed protein product [Protopolystoma xenopodis]|uniref:Uncharacterized protein n=1 Tax=Protopolystoma xenopodis TaxID=117903 RepID=A0A3S5AA58_9PLAT|nr:unnamed protein product [Protopolystoma xenopodis]
MPPGRLQSSLSWINFWLANYFNLYTSVHQYPSAELEPRLHDQITAWHQRSDECNHTFMLLFPLGPIGAFYRN